MRKAHNVVKRRLIESVVSPGVRVLDVGCGAGGDIHKWGVPIHACEPDRRSLLEAIRRGKDTGSTFFLGDIRMVPEENVYDIICYNFSFQYCFESAQLLRDTLDAVLKRSVVGTKCIGVIPDSVLMFEKYPRWTDAMGNTLEYLCTPEGEFHECVNVCVLGAPYYRTGPKSEPIAHKDRMVTEFARRGFVLEHWTPIVHHTTGLLTDVYSEFIFVRVE
jgi:SAM-dependent methyltransferase